MDDDDDDEQRPRYAMFPVINLFEGSCISMLNCFIAVVHVFVVRLFDEFLFRFFFVFSSFLLSIFFSSFFKFFTPKILFDERNISAS